MLWMKISQCEVEASLVQKNKTEQWSPFSDKLKELSYTNQVCVSFSLNPGGCKTQRHHSTALAANCCSQLKKEGSLESAHYHSSLLGYHQYADDWS